MIESLTNSKVKYATKLKQKKYRQIYHQFLVEGNHLVQEAIKSKCVDYIFFTGENPYPDVISFEISETIMKKLSDLNASQGILAICNKPKNKPFTNKLLILDGVQDPGNMGTLIRSAAAFNFHTILIENAVDIYNEKVIRSSQGAIFYANVIEENLVEFIKGHPTYHYYGTNVLNGKDLKEIEFKQSRLAIILGNEGNGVRQEIQALVNTNINIPMVSTESLNVGVAGGILMYEANKEMN